MPSGVCNRNKNISCTDPFRRAYQVLSGNLIITQIQYTAGVVHYIRHLHHFWQHYIAKKMLIMFGQSDHTVEIQKRNISFT
jgi:hypothetical protein